MVSCDHDCLHCPYEDCIEDSAELTAEELLLSIKLDREALRAQKDCLSPYDRSRRQEINAQRRAAYEADPKGHRTYLQAWRAAHREEVNARNRLYYARNKEKVKAQKKAWREAHRDAYNAYQRAYRARKREAKKET